MICFQMMVHNGHKRYQVFKSISALWMLRPDQTNKALPELKQSCTTGASFLKGPVVWSGHAENSLILIFFVPFCLSETYA